MATASLKDAAGLGVALVNQDGNQGDDPVGLEGLEDIRRHDGLSHSAGGCSIVSAGSSSRQCGSHTNGSNDVAQNVVLCALLGEGLGEADQGKLGGGVVGLAEAAKQTGGGRGVDDTAVLLLSEVRPGGLGALVGALDVDLDNQVPVLVLDVLEADVTQDAGVVDEDIDATEGLDGGVDDALAVLDRVVVCDSLAAGCLDLVDDDISGL